VQLSGSRAVAAFHVGYCIDGTAHCTESTAMVLTVEPYPVGGTSGAAVGDDVNTTVGNLIHELAEAITDPVPQYPEWIADNPEAAFGGEVGDVCETVRVPFHQDPNGFRWNIRLGPDRYFSEGIFDARGPTCRP